MTESTIRILLIEDSRDDADLILHQLRVSGLNCDCKVAANLDDARQKLGEADWDLILADYHLPNFDAEQALEILKATGRDTPFIVLTGLVGEEEAVRLMRAGARDFVYKDKIERLGEVVRRELHESKLRIEQLETKSALARSRERGRLIVENSFQAILALDPTTGVIIEANPATQSLFGYSQETLIGKSFALLIPRDSPHTLDKILQEMQPGIVISRSMDLLSESQTLTPVDITAVLIPWEESNAILVTLHDIRERRNAEARIAKQFHKISALRKIDLAITGSLDLRIALNIILDQLVTLLEVDAASVLLFNTANQSLEFAAGRGFRTDALNHAHLRLGEGYAGRAALSRKLVQIPDLRSATGELKRSKDIRDEGFVSYCAVPLIAKGIVKGVVEVFTRAFKPTDAEWLDFLETLAGQTAIAVDSAATFEELQRTNGELELAYDATLEGWSHALDLRDKETEGHTERVTQMTVQLARQMHIPETQIKHIRRGALLHDIGKLGIPDSILLKPGPLTDEEWVVMRKHPVYAYQWLSPILYLRPALDIPWCHHEKYDGTGYPRGLKGENIPLPARIFAIVDVYDAVTSDRPYRKAWSRDKAVEHITSLAGSHFDSIVVNAFLNLLA